MILDHPTKMIGWNVTLAGGDTFFIEANKVETEGGALILRGLKDVFIVSFGPGAWLEVQRA